jgi:hypothetical protein
MIKTKNGKLKIEGTGADLCTDLTVIIRGLYKEISERYDEEFAKMIIKRTCEIGLMSEEELEQEARESATRMLKTIVSALESEEEVDE